jgi:peroxiredoxin-like protein
MQALPHEYTVAAAAAATGSVALSGPGLPRLQTGAPPQFGGSGEEWSPETLLVGAAADCLILTFRAVASASNLAWTELQCSATGKLERAEGVTRFTQLKLHAVLRVPEGVDTQKARRLVEKAEKACLITNSLALIPSLTIDVQAIAG